MKYKLSKESKEKLQNIIFRMIELEVDEAMIYTTMDRKYVMMRVK